MLKPWPDKDPDALLDYELEWGDWLDGDTISNSEWIVPAGITKDATKGDRVSDAGTETIIWLRGGAEGQKYTLTNRITTVAGRIDDRTVTLKIRSK